MVYTRTAAHEGYGGSLTLAITTDTKLPLNYGPGGARLVTISANAGRKVRLPDARLLTPGPTVYVIRNSGANNFGVSSTITAERVPMEMTFSFGQRVNLRTEAERRGYTGDYPLALRVEILSGGTVRSDDPTIPAMDTGVLYAGSTILLVNRGRLYGMGGTGGRGGLGSSANGSAGGAGGDGLFARHSVAVVNLGFIAGGGGGGGGGGSGTIAADGGGGGGGGAGQLGGVGGLGGIAAAGAGGTGLIDVGGIRGNGVGNGAQGGNGGQIGGVGIAGSNGTGGTGGAGGAAGYSLRSAGGGPVITIVTGGTRYGSEVLS
jgi:hypothetical protein